MKYYNLKLASYVISITILIVYGILLSDFLDSNFACQGESFMKGYGQILREDMSKGLVVVVSVNLIPPVLLTYLFFLLLEKEVQRIAYKILRIGAILILLLTLTYVATRVGDGISYGVEENERLIHIVLAWILRVSGFFLGYKLLKFDICRRLIS